MYSDNKTKIRRFLRDPDGNIWDDAYLLNLWNNAQRNFLRSTKFDEQVAILMHPPHYQMSYTHDCEWAYTQHANGKPYRLTVMNWQMPMSCTHLWESQSLSSSTAGDTVIGDRFSHPWEAYQISNPADMTPMWFPYDWEQTLFMSYDNEPLDFKPFKLIQSRDSSYKQYSGKPQWFTVRDEVSGEFYLYPKPSAVWNTIDMTYDTESSVFPLTFPITFGDAWDENADDTGMLVSTDFTTEETELGYIADYSQAETTETNGASFDCLKSDDNVLIAYRRKATDIVNDTDTPDQPRFMQKYMEYEVLERAFQANTDGKIKSLAEYWGWRKQIGHQILMNLHYSRLTDRDFRLTGAKSYGAGAANQRPRLPSTYPAV